MNALNMFQLLTLALLPIFSLEAKPWLGELEKISTRQSDGLKYQCTYRSPEHSIKIGLKLNPRTGYLVVQGDEVEVKGFASQTLERKTGSTYYFLQGGSAPLAQRLTLITRDNGRWARFNHTWGADDFVCEMKN